MSSTERGLERVTKASSESVAPNAANGILSSTFQESPSTTPFASVPAGVSITAALFSVASEFW